MLKLATETIFFVDTHCQWYAEDDCELFVSALSYGGYDAGIMAVPRTTPILEDILRKCRSPFLPCHGSELMFSFAHIIAMGYEGELPEQGDPIEKLRFLRSKAALLLFAHPGGSELLTSGKVHDCFREKLLDGFEYFNGYDFLKGDSLSRELFQTFGYTPVAGCDTHNPRRRKRPSAVYTPDFPPNGPTAQGNDIDTFGGVRTLVFADSCTPSALADAIRHGKTLVEAGGTLYGNPERIRKLEDAGYAQALRQQKTDREKLTLHSSDPVIPGRTITLRLAAPVHGFAVCENREIPIEGDSFSLSVPPDIRRPHLALTVFDRETGTALTSSLQLTSPLELNLESARAADGSSRLQIHLFSRDTERHSGVLTCGPLHQSLSLEPGEIRTFSVPVHPQDPARAQEYSASFSDPGFPCSVRKNLTFLHSGMEFAIRDPGQVYKGLWEGPDDCSARIRIGVEKETIHIHARVTDRCHVQKHHGRFLFFGDSIQIGLTFDRICRDEFFFYNFQAGLTDSGPELHFTGAPPQYCGPYPVDSLLPSRFCSIVPTPDGLEYELFLPLEVLHPFSPETDGKRLNFFLRLFNCNGPQEEHVQGVKAILEYPLRSSCWMIGEGWTTLSF